MNQLQQRRNYGKPWPSPTTEEPSEDTLEEWFMDSVCEAIDGCYPVEHDGYCEHHMPSWFLYLDLI